MISNLNCQHTIDYLMENGAKIIEESTEGKPNFFGRKVVLQKDNCKFKISYLNLGDKEITVEKTCCCKDKSKFKTIPDECI